MTNRNDSIINLAAGAALFLALVLIGILVSPLLFPQAPQGKDTIPPDQAQDIAIAEHSYLAGRYETFLRFSPYFGSFLSMTTELSVIGPSIITHAYRREQLQNNVDAFLILVRDIQRLNPATSQQDDHARLVAEFTSCADGARIVERSIGSDDHDAFKRAYDLLLPCFNTVEDILKVGYP